MEAMTLMAVVGCVVIVALLGALGCFTGRPDGAGLGGIVLILLSIGALTGIVQHMDRDRLTSQAAQNCADWRSDLNCDSLDGPRPIPVPQPAPAPAEDAGPDAETMLACSRMCGSTGVASWFGPYAGRSTRCGGE